MTWMTGVAAGYVDFLDQLQAALCDRGHASGLFYQGTGNGTLTGPTGASGGYVGGTASVAETFTITAIDANTFSVVGSLAGDIGQATVGVPFASTRINFRINGGATAFVAGDQFKLSTTPRWTLARRQGTGAAGRFSNGFANSTRLWDGLVGTTAEFASRAAALPANAGISMIGAADVRRVSITTTNNQLFAPAGFRVEYSDNGSSWTEAIAYANVEWTSTEARSFAVPDVGLHLHWRVVFTASVNGGAAGIVEVQELRFYRGVVGDMQLQQRAEAVLAAPGNDGLDAIYIGIELYEDAAAAARSFNFYQFRSFDPLVAVRSQANNSGLTNVPLSSNNFTWWAAVNGRRIAGVAKIGAVYVPFYQGLGKPYELPSVHPYPAINAGTSSNEAGVATSTDPNFRGFSHPGRYGLRARYPDNVWRPHSNRFLSGSSETGDSATPGKVYPAATTNGGRESDFREALDGSRVLYEIVLTSIDPRHMWGELDGCYFTPGFNLVPEQNITMARFDHMVFQNCFRNAAADFFAIRQD